MTVLLQDKTRLLPPPSQAAFLLDFDGTLVDIASTPESVVVPQNLPDILLALRRRCNDALAVVTGRPIEQIDFFLKDIPYAVAGEHGLALRHRPHDPIEWIPMAPMPSDWIRGAKQIKEKYPAIRIEKKHNGLVIHFRAAPELGEMLREEMQSWVDQQKDNFDLYPSKMAWEIRPSGINKGEALGMILKKPPFLGRRPIFIGDDVTDEDGVIIANEMKGVGFRIPRDFPNPKTLRLWLASLAEGQEDKWQVE